MAAPIELAAWRKSAAAEPEPDKRLTLRDYEEGHEDGGVIGEIAERLDG